MKLRAAVILAALVAPVTAAAAEPGRAVRVEHRAAGDAPTLGPPTAPVTFELFFTPGVPLAHEAYRTLLELQRRHPTRVRAIFRPLHRNQNAPDIVLAAHRRGRFFELMNALSSSSTAPSAAQTIELAVKVGLPRTTAERAHLDDAIQAMIKDNQHRASRLGTTYNPELVINGEPVGRRVQAGSAGVLDLEREYVAAYDEARAALAQGFSPDQLVRWGSQLEECGDTDADDDEEAALPDTREVVLGVTPPGFDPTAMPEKPRPPPRYASRLARLVLRGTGCRIYRHMPATLDEGAGMIPPGGDSAMLLAAPLPTAGMPSFGPGDAPVPIFVVCNLRGRACLEQIDLARRVAEHHPGNVRVVWVPWVATALEGADRDLTLAQAALCAARDGDGWGFLRAVTAAGVPARGRVDLAAIAATAGLDADSIVACASGEPVEARTAVQAAHAAGVGWGPTLVIGGRAYIGGFSDDRRASQRVAGELAPGLLEALVPTEP